MNSIQLRTGVLSNLLLEFNLGSCLEQIIKSTEVSTYFLPSKENNLGVFSKLGGTPSLPVGTIYPENLGFPMQFLMQIKLSELAHVEKGKVYLPPQGLMYLFTDERQELTSSFSSYVNPKECLNHFKMYPKNILRQGKGEEFKVLFFEDEKLEMHQISPAPSLIKYPFLTYTKGFYESDLIRPELFLLPAEKLDLDIEYFLERAQFNHE